MKQQILFLINAFTIATKRSFCEKCTLYVSALSFTTLLAIVPLLSISVYCVTKFPLFIKFIDIAEKYIFQNLIPSSAESIQIYLLNFIHQAAHLPIFSVIFLFITGIMMFSTIEYTINNIWEIDKPRKKFLVWSIYSIILLIAPFLLGISIFVTSYLISQYFLSAITYFLMLFLPVFFNTLIFSLFYIYVPNTKVKIFYGFLCGFIVSILIEIARSLFTLWVSYFSNYEIIYGVFSILPIFLLWLYICWYIILWGAIATHSLSTLPHK